MLLKINRDQATPRVYLRHDSGHPRFARVKGTAGFLKKNSIVCYTGAKTGGTRCGRIQQFQEPVRYDSADDPSRGPRRIRSMRVRLFDKCRDHRGDSGAATYASRPGEMGIYAVGIVSGQYSGAGAKPGDNDCADEGEHTTKLIIIQGIGPVLTEANGISCARTCVTKGSSLDPQSTSPGRYFLRATRRWRGCCDRAVVLGRGRRGCGIRASLARRCRRGVRRRAAGRPDLRAAAVVRRRPAAPAALHAGRPAGDQRTAGDGGLADRRGHHGRQGRACAQPGQGGIKVDAGRFDGGSWGVTATRRASLDLSALVREKDALLEASPTRSARTVVMVAYPADGCEDVGPDG